MVDDAYSLHFSSLWLPTERAFLHKWKCKNRASFLIRPEVWWEKSGSSRECFGRLGNPWCHPCAWTVPAATGSGAKATQPQCEQALLHQALALAAVGQRRADSVACTTVESLQLDEHQLCIVSKSKCYSMKQAIQRNSMGKANAKEMKICPKLWQSTRLLFTEYHQSSLIEDFKYLGRDYKNIQRYNICILNVNLTQRSVHEGMFIISTPINSQMTLVFYKLVRNKSLP